MKTKKWIGLSLIALLVPALVWAARVSQFPAGINTTRIQATDGRIDNMTIDELSMVGSNLCWVSANNTIAAHDNATAVGSIAWCVASFDGDNGTIVVPPRDAAYVIANDYAPASNVTWIILNGARIEPALGQTLTFSSPNNIEVRGTKRVFGGAGAVVFTNPGIVYVDWWGPAKDGTDDYTALNAALTSVPHNATVVFGVGTYSTGTSLSVTKDLSLVGTCGSSTKIEALAGLTGSLIHYHSSTTTDVAQEQIIKCLELDGNDIASDGLDVAKGYNLYIEKNYAHHFTNAGFFVNGHIMTGSDNISWIFNVHFRGNKANYNHYGYLASRDWGDNTTDYGSGNTLNWRVYDRISFDGDFAENNVYGFFCKGDNKTSLSPAGFSVTADNIVVEGTNVDAAVRLKDGASMILSNAYIEASNGAAETFHFWLTNKARLNVIGGMGLYWDAKYEDNSTACTYGGYSGSLYGFGYAPMATYCVGDLISDKLTWGSPNWPNAAFFANHPCQNHTCGGYYGWKGMVSIDSSGNEWMQVDDNYTLAGGKVSGANRWSPKTGRIVIPITYVDLNCQNIPLFWAEADFVITGLDIIIETTFVNSSCDGNATLCGLPIGTYPADWNDYITIDNGRGAWLPNLTAGNTIRAWDNNDTTSGEAVLSWVTDSRKHRAKLMPGYSVNVMDVGYAWMTTYANSYIIGRPVPYSGWTEGSGWIVITGYPLEYN